MRRREWRQGVLTVVLLLLAVWLGSLIWGLADKAFFVVKRAGETQAKYEELEARKAALEADVEALATPRGQDAAIREAFGVAREDEEVIVVVPPAPATSTPPLPWWQRALNWF